MQIRTLNVDDDQAMSAAFFIECAATQQARPGWEPVSQDARILGWRADDGWRNHLLGAWDGTTLLGFAAGMNAADTPETTWVLVWVAPKYQRAGIGTALVRAIEGTSQDSTTRFTSSAYRSSTNEIDELTRRFSQPLGYALATTETVVELDLRKTRLPEPNAVDGYEIYTYVNGVPEQFREKIGQIKGRVDAEAPNGDLGWAETTVSPAEYASEIELWVAQGHTVFESIAVDLTGSVAAWTCLLSAAEENRPAQIEGTLVVAKYRGQGLGAAIKLASLTQAAKLTDMHKVRTSSDDENVWMRSINSTLGFLPVETEIILQKDALRIDDRLPSPQR